MLIIISAMVVIWAHLMANTRVASNIITVVRRSKIQRVIPKMMPLTDNKASAASQADPLAPITITRSGCSKLQLFLLLIIVTIVVIVAVDPLDQF